MVSIGTLHTVDTEYSADSVEWCPTTGHTDYFLCGTYQLEENKSAEPDVPAKRKGRLYLFHYDADKDLLEKRDCHETAAILDLKWNNGHPSEGKPTAAAANALGEVLLYQLNDGQMVETSKVALNSDDDNLLTLAVDWNPASVPTRQLLASDSKGNISLLQVSDVGLDVLSTWASHSFEAWTCAFNKWNPNVVYSGGDDMALVVYDTRMQSKVLTNRSHNAGVTTLLSFADAEHMLATGSYDEELRIFDTRRFKSELSSTNLGGGIWRIRQNPARKDWLLCANMYHNFSVVQLAEGFESSEVVAEYHEHGSICYGADWQYGHNGKPQIMGTCSFYDHKLCVSKVE